MKQLVNSGRHLWRFVGFVCLIAFCLIIALFALWWVRAAQNTRAVLEQLDRAVAHVGEQDGWIERPEQKHREGGGLIVCLESIDTICPAVNRGWFGRLPATGKADYFTSMLESAHFKDIKIEGYFDDLNHPTNCDSDSESRRKLLCTVKATRDQVEIGIAIYSLGSEHSRGSLNSPTEAGANKVWRLVEVSAIRR